MAEKSYLWTTNGTGDGTGTGYTQTDAGDVFKIAAICFGYEGVGPNFTNTLTGTVTGANTVSIDIGAAIVDSRPYKNTAAVSVNIPSASGGGNTRIDRIVLRADWAAQTVRITRIAGVDAASPTAPAITQNSGTTYDIMLYQALVDTSGNVTLTDERTWGKVDNSEIRDSAGLSVVGRASNSTGSVADIAAGTDGQVLRRSGTSIGFGQLAAGAVPNSLIATAMIANDAVDDTKVGNRVPQFYRRQGGSATDWTTQGTSTQTPTTVRMQSGVIRVANGTAGTTVTFPTAFSNKPHVFLTPIDDGIDFTPRFTAKSITASTFVCYNSDGSNLSHGNEDVQWLAIGPE